MLADLAAFCFSLVALLLSVWLYVAGVSNRILTTRTQKNQVRATLLQNQLDEYKAALLEQQEKLSRISETESGRPAIVSEIATLANWNSNQKLRELLIKHGFDASRQSQGGK